MKLVDGRTNRNLSVAQHHLYVPLSNSEGMLTFAGIAVADLSSSAC